MFASYCNSSTFPSGEDRDHEIAAPVGRNHGWPGRHRVWRTSVKQHFTSRTPWAAQLYHSLWPSNDDDGTTHPAHSGTLKYPNNIVQAVSDRPQHTDSATIAPRNGHCPPNASAKKRRPCTISNWRKKQKRKSAAQFPLASFHNQWPVKVATTDIFQYNRCIQDETAWWDIWPRRIAYATLGRG